MNKLLLWIAALLCALVVGFYLGRASLLMRKQNEKTELARSPAYSEAVDALKGLQSVTNSGLNYGNYAPRVLDAKVKVDKYLSTVKTHTDAKAATVGLAMQYYEIAAAAWNSKIAGSGSGYFEVGQVLRKSAALAECPTVQAIIANSDAVLKQRYYYTPSGKIARVPKENSTLEQAIKETQREQARQDDVNLKIGEDIGDHPNSLWACASTKLDTL